MDHLESPKREDLHGSSHKTESKLLESSDETERINRREERTPPPQYEVLWLGFPNALKARGRGAPGHLTLWGCPQLYT